VLRLGLGQGVRVAVELVRRLAQGASDQPGLAVEVVERVTARARGAARPLPVRVRQHGVAQPLRCLDLVGGMPQGVGDLTRRRTIVPWCDRHRERPGRCELRAGWR